MEELIKEAESRCSCFVAAFRLIGGDEKGKEMKFRYGSGEWSRAAGLSSILHNDIINNWNGELQTLKRIAEEEDE